MLGVVKFCVDSSASRNFVPFVSVNEEDAWTLKYQQFRKGRLFFAILMARLRFWIFLVLSIDLVLAIERNPTNSGTLESEMRIDDNRTIWINRTYGEDESVNINRLLENNLYGNFMEWSEWSACDRRCTQSRVRRCRVWEKCADTVLRAERSCDRKRKSKPDRRCSRERRRGRYEKKNHFHIVQVLQNPEESRVSTERRRKKGSKKRPPSDFGKWSKWSPCSKTCTTERYRWCNWPGKCDRDVIREKAYCYVEGSFCQKWIRRMNRDSNENLNAEPEWNELALKPYTIPGLSTPQKEVNASSCGFPTNGKDSRLSYLTKIVGGKPAKPGSWPWQVALLNRYREPFCGGTLVSWRWVLTAAHCIRKRLYVRIGEYDLSAKEGPELEFRVDTIIVHPEYDADIVDNDVALLRLPVILSPGNSRGIACLPISKQPLPKDQLCMIIGWGKSQSTDDFGTDLLHEAKIPIVSKERCRKVYNDYKITNNMFCAGYRRGRMDSCAGDSGGPLLCRDMRKSHNPWTIFGVTSFGEDCGKRGKYGIYAKIPNYVDWITKVIRESNAT